MSAELESAPPIELQEVHVVSPRASTARVLEGVNWRVEVGDFWIVAGLAGMGKSALLQTVCGVLGAGGGEVRLFGQPLAAMAESELSRERRRFSLVFENGGRLFGQMSVAENAALPYCYHHNCRLEEAREPLEKVLSLTDLAAYASHRPARVPRALCPRVGLARALITGPEVLLLDNPLHGIEPREQAWWLEVLGRLAREPGPCQPKPLTLIVASDHFQPWLELGTRFGFIKNRTFTTIGDRATLAAGRAVWPQDLLAPMPGSG